MILGIMIEIHLDFCEKPFLSTAALIVAYQLCGADETPIYETIKQDKTIYASTLLHTPDFNDEDKLKIAFDNYIEAAKAVIPDILEICFDDSCIEQIRKKFTNQTNLIVDVKYTCLYSFNRHKFSKKSKLI